MSTQQPSSSRAAAAYEESSGDESMNTVLWVGGGVLILLAFLALLCVGTFVIGSMAGGHPMTDIFLTPAP
jgi:hypothetical protein